MICKLTDRCRLYTIHTMTGDAVYSARGLIFNCCKGCLGCFSCLCRCSWPSNVGDCFNCDNERCSRLKSCMWCGFSRRSSSSSRDTAWRYRDASRYTRANKKTAEIVNLGYCPILQRSLSDGFKMKTSPPICGHRCDDSNYTDSCCILLLVGGEFAGSHDQVRSGSNPI